MSLELDLPSDVRRNLPPGGDAFLRELGESLDADAVRCVLLFGSVVAGGATDVSDVDLLVVLEEGVDDDYRATVQARCLALAEEHLPAEADRGNPLERAVDRATGMFRSGFVVAADDVEAGAFHAVFNTSRLAYALAPWRTVLAAVFDGTEAVYGPPVTPDWSRVEHPSARPVRELVRSWLTATLLASAQLAYGLVSIRAVQYAMEAHKWTLYNCSFHLAGGRVGSLADASDVVPGGDGFDRRLLELRAEPRRARRYVALAPLYVTLAHLRTVRAVVQGGRRSASQNGS